MEVGAQVRCRDVREVVRPLLDEDHPSKSTAEPPDGRREALLDLEGADAGAAICPRDGKIGALVRLEQDRRAARRRSARVEIQRGMRLARCAGPPRRLVVAQVVDGAGREPWQLYERRDRVVGLMDNPLEEGTLVLVGVEEAERAWVRARVRVGSEPGLGSGQSQG